MKATLKFDDGLDEFQEEIVKKIADEEKEPKEARKPNIKKLGK